MSVEVAEEKVEEDEKEVEKKKKEVSVAATRLSSGRPHDDQSLVVHSHRTVYCLLLVV